MTRKQEIAVNRLKKLTEDQLFYGHDGSYEIKEWTVHECEYFVSVVGETGMKNDSGTWAALLCRDRFQIFIGPRGGMTYPVTGRGKKHVTRRFNGYSLLTVVIDQRH